MTASVQRVDWILPVVPRALWTSVLSPNAAIGFALFGAVAVGVVGVRRVRDLAAGLGVDDRLGPSGGVVFGGAGRSIEPSKDMELAAWEVSQCGRALPRHRDRIVLVEGVVAPQRGRSVAAELGAVADRVVGMDRLFAMHVGVGVEAIERVVVARGVAGGAVDRFVDHGEVAVAVVAEPCLGNFGRERGVDGLGGLAVQRIERRGEDLAVR